MDYIFSKDMQSLAKESYDFMKDHIEKYGFVTLAQVDSFIGCYHLHREIENANDIGWSSIDGINFGWRDHEIIYADRRGGRVNHTDKYCRAMTLTIPDPIKITY